MRSRWPILVLLCVLASLLVPGIASASTVAGTETRVWAFDLAERVSVEVQRSLTLDLRQGCEPTYDQLASDSLLAARGGGKASKVTKSKTTESIGGGRFTKTTDVRPGKGPGQSRAEYVRIKNADGKTIRTYKDSYDRANKFQSRKPLRGGPEGRPQGGGE